MVTRTYQQAPLATSYCTVATGARDVPRKYNVCSRTLHTVIYSSQSFTVVNRTPCV